VACCGVVNHVGHNVTVRGDSLIKPDTYLGRYINRELNLAKGEKPQSQSLAREWLAQKKMRG
jgi:hypothetical protein